MRYGTFALSILFQSTLSVRRATDTLIAPIPSDGISIHALRKESDSLKLVRHLLDKTFQSTLSVRRATPNPR